jgi:hypothetical protein
LKMNDTLDPAHASINGCFSVTHGLVSHLIRWLTRSCGGDAMITFRSATLGKVLVLEATDAAGTAKRRGR